MYASSQRLPAKKWKKWAFFWVILILDIKITWWVRLLQYVYQVLIKTRPDSMSKNRHQKHLQFKVKVRLHITSKHYKLKDPDKIGVKKNKSECVVIMLFQHTWTLNTSRTSDTQMCGAFGFSADKAQRATHVFRRLFKSQPMNGSHLLHDYYWTGMKRLSI